jgi:hypothetical protein
MSKVKEMGSWRNLSKIGILLLLVMFATDIKELQKLTSSSTQFFAKFSYNVFLFSWNSLEVRINLKRW